MRHVKSRSSYHVLQTDGDGACTSVRSGDEPERQNERKRRAQCHNNGLELGSEIAPGGDEVLVRLAGVALAARGIRQRIISAVHSKHVVGSARNECDENNEASRDKALSLLSYSTHCTFDNSARPLSFPVDAIAVGGEKRVSCNALGSTKTGHT